MIRLAKAMCAERPATYEMEPEEFAGEVRRLAIDAYKGLTYPDVPRDELARLKLRSNALFRQSRASKAIEMTKWLCSVSRAIDVRLQYEKKVGPKLSGPPGENDGVKGVKQPIAKLGHLVAAISHCKAPKPSSRRSEPQS
jgi:hypothetical protein